MNTCLPKTRVFPRKKKSDGKRATTEPRIPIGPYRGTPISEVPQTYINWLLPFIPCELALEICRFMKWADRANLYEQPVGVVEDE
mgnify:FL=1